MKRHYTFLMAAFLLLALFTIPIGMRGQTTHTIGWGTASGTEGTYTNFTDVSGSIINVLSFTTAKNSSSSNPAYNANASELRLYYASNGSGGSITITPASGITITDAVMTTSTSPSVQYSVDGGTATSVTASSNTYTISNISASSSLMIQNVNTTNTQLRIKTIALTYTTSGSQATTYTVTYHANVAGTTDIEEVYYEGDDVTVAANTFSNPGYAFTEWNTAENGSGQSYAPDDVIEDIDDDWDLYAQWEESSEMTLNFPLNSNPNSWPTSTVSSLTEYTYPLNGVDYTFALKNVKYSTNYLMVYYVGAVGLPAIEGYKLTKVVASNSSGCSTATKVGISSSASQENYIDGGAIQTWSTQGSQYTYNLTSTEVNTMYYLYVTNKNAQIINLALTYEAATAPSVATPTFSPADGTEFGDEGLSVTITCETSGADIFYTLDGSEPDDESTPYNGAITLSETTTIKAIAYADDMASNVATATYTYVDPNAPGTVNNPYTVAQARDAIDANTGLVDVYATGIISQVDSYNTQYNSITYWISDDGTTTSDQLEVYSGKGLNNSNFSSIDDVEVGATVVVFGTLKKYNSTYEFDKNNYLVSYTAPIHAVETPTFSPVAGTYATTQMVTISCASDGADIFYTLDGSDPDDESEPYSGTITVTEATTIKAIAYADDMESVIATATYHICSQDNPYTVTQALNFAEYQYPANNVYVHGIVSTAPTSLSSGALTYYISVDGTATNELEVYKGKGLNNEAFTAADDIQVGDIVTIYGNVQVYNGTIEFGSGNYLVEFERPTTPAQEYTLTISNLVNVNTYVFAGDESEMLFEGEGSAQILEGTEVMISVDVEEGYVLQSLMVDGTDHAADIAGGMYIFDMPDHDVTVTATAVENVAPADGDYVRISSLDQLTDGSKVIIAARHDEDHTNGYYAMPGQTTGRPTGVAFTSETSGNNEILPTTITVSEDTYYWTVNVTEDGYTFTNAENQMIGYSSGTNFATGGNNTEWTISIGTAAGSAMVGGYTGFVIRNGNTDTRAFAFNGTAFGAYATTNMTSSGYNFFLDFFVQSNETPEESYTLTINGYGNNNAPSHYYLIASPVTVDLSNHELTTGDFDLYRFDQTQENEWQNYKQNNFNLEPGKGYLYANKIGGDFELSGTAYDGDGTVTLVKNDNSPRFPGWNLVGNPYGDVAYIQDGRDFYVLTDGSEVLPYDGNDIQPLQGIFVVATNNNESMTFTTTAPASTGEKFVFNISQGRGDVIDRAMVRFGEGRTLPKFQLFETSTKLYIPQTDDDYAVVYATEHGTLPLNFRAAENGAYTISFDNQAGEFASLHLIDNKTRADIDLLTNPSYTFNAETTDDEDRFTLVYSKAGAQTLPYSYGFEDNNLATDGWTAQITSTSSGINSAAAHTGSLGFRFQYSENPGYLVSPLLTGGGTNGIELSFYYKEYSSSYGDENFQVGYTTDANETDPSNFSYGEIIEATTSWQLHTETLPAGTVRMAIKYLYVDAFYLYLDDFTFEVSNPCSKPTDLAVTTDGQTATVTWDGTAANNFIVTVNNGTPATGQTSPYTFNVDLSSTYEVTVMADCGAVGTSNPESISFSTPDCLGGHIISYDLSDSYGDGWNGNAINIVDECGNLIETLTIASGSSNNGTLSLCGDYYQFTWTAGGYADETSFTLLDNGVAIYSNQSGSSLTDGQVLYTIGTNTRIPRPTALTAGTPGYDNVDLSWTENGTATAWEVCINGDESNLVPANTNVNFNLTGLQPDNSYSVKVRAVSGSYISCWSDEVTVTTPVACARPTGLTEANITFTTADLSWTGTANSYVAEYGIWVQAGTDQIATETLDPYTFDLSGFSGKGTVAIRHYNVTDMFYLNVDDIVVKDANGNVVYSEDFESGSIPANISNIDLDGDGYMWAMGTNGISGQSNITVNGHYGLYSASWYGGNALNPDNWLVISDITLGGSITFKAVGQDPSVPYENFAVYVIADNQFTEAYSGTRTSCQVTGLTEGTAYAWRVQGDCGEYASNWVFSMFKTPDNLLIFATEGNWDNPRNWTDTEGNTATTLPTADNKVRIDADATIPAGVVATAKNAVLNGGSIEIEEGGQLKQGGTVKVTMHKGIEGYGAGNEEDADHYYFIATPHSCSYLEESDLFPYVLNVTDGNYDLYAFDPTQELEWINFKSNSDHSEFHTGNNTGLFNKKGYLYANEDDTDLKYVGTVSSSLNNILTESFTYSETSTDDFNGWRLVGNPFTCDAYISYVDDNGDVLEADFYTLNDGKTYTLSESNVGLAPLAGALINYSATGKIQFASEEPTGGKRSGMLNMTLTQGRGKVDQARIRFGQGYNLDKISFRNNSSRLYIPQDNRDYAVVYAEAMGEMPVNFKAEQNGNYTLSFNNEEVTFTYLHLIDNLTGADVDLLVNPSYNFDAKTTDYASRFKLVYTTGTTADSDNFGFISNNHLMILGLDGQATLKIMDVTGRTLSIETFSGSYDKALNLSSGVYMLQLIQGSNVKTQKIVVK